MTTVKAIFCISPGRSGSHYLSELLSHAKNCDSHHESEPSGFGAPLRAMNLGDPGAMNDVALRKRDQIDASTANGRVFCDTSHCFIKGFGWTLLEHLDPRDVGIVVLKRPRQAVVDSTFRIRCVPLSKAGRTYILTPDRHDPIMRPPSFFGLPGKAGFMAAAAAQVIIFRLRGLKRRLGMGRDTSVPLPGYQKAAIGWYWDETYALADRFRHAYPACRYFEVSVDDLNTPGTVAALFDIMGLAPKPGLQDRIGTATNLKAQARSRSAR